MWHSHAFSSLVLGGVLDTVGVTAANKGNAKNGKGGIFGGNCTRSSPCVERTYFSSLSSNINLVFNYGKDGNESHASPGQDLSNVRTDFLLHYNIHV